MFCVKDKVGKEINIKDQVSYMEVQDDWLEEGEEVEKEGIVIGFPKEGMVHVQPTKGAPMEMLSEHCTVTGSLVTDIEKLAGDEELQKVLMDAEARYNEEVKKSGTKKGGGGGKKKSAAPSKVTGTIELEL